MKYSEPSNPFSSPTCHTKSAERLGRAAIKDFRTTFQVSEGAQPLKEGSAQPLSKEEQEALKRFRRPSPEEYRERAGPAADAGGAQLPG